MGDNGPPYFAEYSLWNDSAYSIFSLQSYNKIQFVAGSVFLNPGEAEEKDKDLNEVHVVTLPIQPRVRSSPGFERYMRRAFKVVTRQDLTRDPAFFYTDLDSDDSDSSLDRLLNQDLYSNPPGPRWRTTQQINGRGRKKPNLMQQRLEQALAQPAIMERGASMMRSMGWAGGALGLSGGGITEPIPPNPYYVKMLNAAYANTTAGLGLAMDSSGESSESDTAVGKRQQPQKKSKKNDEQANPQQKRTKKKKQQDFVTNVLLYIREFVKNDLQVEMFFEARLNPRDRHIIHQIVDKLMHHQAYDSDVEFDTTEMVHLVEDIERRNNYMLGTISKGDPPERQICIYKEATRKMYLVTPEDVRPEGEDEDESNPFLQSITRHIKADGMPAPCAILDSMIDYFVEFSSEDLYTEFRFLGAFTMEEIDIMSAFFGMISCLIEKSPYLDMPERLVQAFERGNEYAAAEDANGYISIKKTFIKKKEKEEDKEVKK